MIEAMQWCNPSDNLTAFREREGRRIVAWIRSLQGEARYEPAMFGGGVTQTMTQPARIAIRTINGWRYMQPGQWAVVGVSWFLVSNTESPDSMAWHVRDFKIMTNADYLTYKKVNGV